jgi:hypothetical protein
MATTDAYDGGSEDTSQDFTANDFRNTRALDASGDCAARVHTLRHLLKQVGHRV